MAEMGQHALLLEARTITKRFGGLRAVNEASVRIEDGSIVSLIGPNGAGKTTLFAIISGFHAPDAGQVIFRGDDITGRPPHEICRLGMTRTFQIVQPFAGLSVRQNIAIGSQLRHPTRKMALEHADEMGRLVGMAPMLDQRAENLTVCGRKRLELARALATGPTLLLLDEVMAGLIPPEIAEVVETIRTIRRSGVAILLIEHVMAAVMQLSDRVYVLAEGRIIAEGVPADLVRNERVIEAYLGAGAAQGPEPAGLPASEGRSGA